jgi:hypothetical protein
MAVASKSLEIQNNVLRHNIHRVGVSYAPASTKWLTSKAVTHNKNDDDKTKTP